MIEKTSEYTIDEIYIGQKTQFNISNNEKIKC